MWNREFGTHWSIWVWDWAYSPFICSTGSDLAFDLPEVPEVNYVGMAGSDVFSVSHSPEVGKKYFGDSIMSHCWAPPDALFYMSASTGSIFISAAWCRRKRCSTVSLPDCKCYALKITGLPEVRFTCWNL